MVYVYIMAVICWYRVRKILWACGDGLLRSQHLFFETLQLVVTVYIHDFVEQ